MFCGCIFNNVVYRAMKYYMGELTDYPSIDKPWLKYYSEEAINVKIPEEYYCVVGGKLCEVSYSGGKKAIFSLFIFITKELVKYSKNG